jgi:hypothetical protein
VKGASEQRVQSKFGDQRLQPLSDRCATPQTTIEAIMYTVRVRGAPALTEPANIERLSRCNAAARTEINRRIASLIATKKIAP